MDQQKSNTQYDHVIATCSTEFFAKNSIYGQSWTRYRPMSLLEKICIKLERIQTIQRKKEQLVEDSLSSEFPAIINYCILSRIKCLEWRQKKQFDDTFSREDLQKLYDEQVQHIKDIFIKKNHDYGESWRRRTISFMIDECLVKYDRAASINTQSTLSDIERAEKFEEILADICNYAIFCTIRISEGTSPMI